MQEDFPSTVDIDLAIERFICYHHIENHPEVLIEQSKLKNKYISDFYAPNYLVDMGPVILETTATYTAIIMNYGPTPANVRLLPLSKISGIRSCGFTIQFEQACKLPVGETLPMYIVFRPKKERFKQRITEIHNMLYLEVEHGPRIPIRILAIATKPFLSFDPVVCRFNQVLCGDAVMLSLRVINEYVLGPL